MEAATSSKQRDPRAIAYGRKLQGVLDSRGLSRRAFSKLVSPDNPEGVRRAVHRHLAGVHMPGRVTRRRYEAVLSLETGSLEPDDEEADPAMREAFVLFADLMGRLQNRPVRDGAQA